MSSPLRQVNVPINWDEMQLGDLTVKQMCKILKDHHVKGFCRGTREQLETELTKLKAANAAPSDADLGLDSLENENL